MAAEIIEAHDSDVDELDTVPVDESAMSPEQVIDSFSEADTIVPLPIEDDLPEKYRGKNLKDIVSMHQEAEKALGRQGSEVGELRKVVDTYISSQFAQTSQAQQEPEEELDFFEDPQKAVNSAIERHPEVLAARRASEQMKAQTSLAALQQKHPDMQSVLQNPGFMEWVRGSEIRMELYQRADKGYDFNSADELISLYKERTQVAQQTIQTENVARQQAIKQASTGSASGTNTAGAKRVYRRADIIKLMKTDPDRYEALSEEIMRAYQEGRVR